MLQFGVEMGSGLRTYITSRLPYIIGLALLAGISTGWSVVAIALGFAAGRAVPVVVALAFGDRLLAAFWKAVPDGNRLVGRLLAGVGIATMLLAS